ncbi:hypothetical protein [Dactylosporangium sp. NPDC000521]|uniref:hypothetical protein n=1 Tax=Dactylosporangium sp. NPDC000521 TaxID=3363975 RepID=UPI0036809E79
MPHTQYRSGVTGGDLTAESAPGAGTTVRIVLPGTGRCPDRPRPAVAAPDPSGATVLVAEDEDGVRDVVTRLLTRAGYHVHAAPRCDGTKDPGADRSGEIK